MQPSAGKSAGSGKKTNSKVLDARKGGQKHQIAFVISLMVMKGLNESFNGTTMQISWQEKGSRSNTGQTSVKVVKKKEIEWGENLMFDSKLSFQNGAYQPRYIILSLRKAGGSSSIDKGCINLHDLALLTDSRTSKITFDKGTISLTFTSKATPKQFGNQRIIAPSSQVSNVDAKHRVLSHGVEWATETAQNLTETDAGGSLGSTEDFDFDNFAANSLSPEKRAGSAPGLISMAEFEELKQKVASQEKSLASQKNQIEYLQKRDQEQLKEIKELKLKLSQQPQQLQPPPGKQIISSSDSEAEKKEKDDKARKEKERTSCQDQISRKEYQNTQHKDC